MTDEQATAVEATLQRIFNNPSAEVRLYGFMYVQWAYYDAGLYSASELANLLWHQELNSHAD